MLPILLIVLFVIPILGFLVNLSMPRKNENNISFVAIATVATHLLAILALIVWMAFLKMPIVGQQLFSLFQNKEFEFIISLYFDKIGATYLLTGAFLTFLVNMYSRTYMHRESGYKRFFNTIMLFYAGYSITVIAGNIETLFLGWELLGLSSFLLIAFYRNRYLPVKNAVKVFSIYRIGDVGIIMAMWLSHHLWHQNISFQQLQNLNSVHQQLQSHTAIGVLLAALIFISAAAKSAQLPFSSWLPRAMEGPTPSSAIFYGALSVHMGVFLLMRMYPIWEHQYSVRICMALWGLITAIVANYTARVQSAIKSQIAYSSIAQIGLIFIEVSAGFENFALFHFAGNAFLRTYQLLVSPSVVTYLIREQQYQENTPHVAKPSFLPAKWMNTLYMLSLKEWNLDNYMFQYLWHPLKVVGKKLDFLTIKWWLISFSICYVIGLWLLYQTHINGAEQRIAPTVFLVIALLMVLKSFTERNNVFLSWILIIMSHLWVALAIAFNEAFSFFQIHLYLSGVLVGGIIGYMLLLQTKRLETNLNLHQFHGLSFKHPKLAMAFLLCCLSISGFPISPSFIGEDLIFSHIHQGQILIALMVALIFLIDGIALIRLYARIFLGPHAKAQADMAFRSA